MIHVTRAKTQPNSLLTFWATSITTYSATTRLCLHASIPLFVSIKEDDKLIQEEGVDSLSEAELREDCRERGMLGLLSVEEMRQQVFMLWTILCLLVLYWILDLDEDIASLQHQFSRISNVIVVFLF